MIYPEIMQVEQILYIPWNDTVPWSCQSFVLMPVLGNCFSLDCTSSIKGPSNRCKYSNHSCGDNCSTQLYASILWLELQQQNPHKSKHEQLIIGFSVAEVVASYIKYRKSAILCVMIITVQNKTSSFILLICKECKEIRT